MYTEDNFEEYSERVIRERCVEHGYTLNKSAMEGSIENNRDDAFDEDDAESYTDDDIWDEYMYFVIYETLDTFLEHTAFNGRHLAPVHDDQEMTYEINVYREGDDPYTFYDTARMDLYRGTYAINPDGTMSFTLPTKVVHDA